MSLLRALTCTLALLLAAPALGQAPGPRSRIDEISTLRLDLERLDDGRRQVRAQRDDLARRLESLARAIETRKAAGAGGGLLPDFRLQADLRTSQELAEAISLLNRELDQLDGAYRARLARLGALYDEAVEGTVGALRSAGGAARGDLARVLARLRAERDDVQRRLSPGHAPRDPGAPEPGADLLASDDPEELAERADAVRDEQDKLRQKLALLDGRIASLDRELRLDREMRDFLTDQDLFGEQSRVLRVPRASEAAKDDGAQGGRTDSPPGAVGEGNVDMAYDGAADPQPAEPNDPTQPPPDGRLPVGVPDTASSAPGADRPLGLQGLRQERSALVERLKRLQVLHDRLRDKAEELAQE